MEVPKELVTFNGISAIAFNKDLTQCCLSKKDKYLYVYKITNIDSPSEWKLIHQLKSVSLFLILFFLKHFEYVSSIDWNHTTNNIISCSYDKNIFVWNYDEIKNIWKPNLVYFKSKLSLLKIKWNPLGTKFAACCAANNFIVGYYDNELNWWKGEPIKSHKSATTSINFDSTGQYVISGSTDLKISITCCIIKIDDLSIKTSFDESTKVSFTLIFIVYFQ